MHKKKIILFHVLFWFFDFFKDAVYGFQYYYFYESQYTLESLYKTTAIDFMRTLLTAALFYANASVLVPRLFSKGKYVLYVISVLALVVAFTPVHYLLETILLKYFSWSTYGREITMIWIFQSVLRGSIMYILLGIAYGYVVDYFKTQEEKKQLEQAKLTTELAFLRSQINPHFLFNTINDIYSLTYQKSDLAPDALLKLSGLLRYMLRESEQQQVLLKKEVDYLQDVVELQRIGLKGNAFIDLTAEGSIEGKLIAPLMLISFVENAFKHGVCTDPVDPVSIGLRVEEHTLYFTVFNKKNKDQKDKTGGIGLTNVRRRLELLYPEKYTLDITEDEQTYLVELSLQLGKTITGAAKPTSIKTVLAEV
ncbi:sensor histidine kinase [Pontibacter sp. H249]|uniref:sensor histidine kinase n=1 Tax=Pontibacter sp. H249 TaxID=3133420 RepID=UPI0030BC5870